MPIPVRDFSWSPAWRFRFTGFNIWPRWIVTAITLYLVLVVIAVAGYSPSLRSQRFMMVVKPSLGA